MPQIYAKTGKFSKFDFHIFCVTYFLVVDNKTKIGRFLLLKCYNCRIKCYSLVIYKEKY